MSFARYLSKLAALINSSGQVPPAALSTGGPFWDTSGNVGIGTNGPTNKLDVIGSIQSGSTLADNTGQGNVAVVSNTGNSSKPRAQLIVSGSAYVPTYQAIRANNAVLYSAYADLCLNADTSNNICFWTGANERARLDAAGNFGINNNAPSYPLDIIGAQIRVSSNSTLGTRMTFTSTSTNGRSYQIGSNFSVGAGEFAIYDSTAAANRLVIDTSGNLLVGQTSDPFGVSTGVSVSSGGHVMYLQTTAGGGYSCLNLKRTASDGNITQHYRGTTYVGGITVSATTSSYLTSSDYRLKDVTGALAGYKERLLALQPKQGFWKTDGSEFRGFLAHEFAESYPASVNGEKDAVDEQGNPQYQGMQAGSAEVIADLVAMVQEQQAIIEALTQRVAALEA